jgi:hypothetical protein
MHVDYTPPTFVSTCTLRLTWILHFTLESWRSDKCQVSHGTFPLVDYVEHGYISLQIRRDKPHMLKSCFLTQLLKHYL